MRQKDTQGLSKRQEFRERRRRSEQRNRFFGIGLIVVAALAVAFSLIYPQTKPIAAIQPATPLTRPNVVRNTTGSANAPVKLEEFSDFQCPYCKQFWQNTESQILDAYVKTGKVAFTDRSAGNWVSNNIGQGSFESQDAAMAAYCAADQNKFWEMHDALVTNAIREDAGSFTSRRLKLIAQSVGLDMNAFNSCTSSQKYLNQVNQDYQDALSAKITGTPFFVISYTPKGQTQAVTTTVDGAQPFSVFQQAFDTALAAAGQ